MLPLVVSVLMGIVEMGLLMRDTTAVNSLARTAARTASAAAGAGQGSCESNVSVSGCNSLVVPGFAKNAVDAVQKAGTALPPDSITSMKVYRANAAGYPFPAGNTTMTCSLSCVTYVWNKTTDRFVYSSGTWDYNKDVNACLNDGAADSVGIVVTAKHPWLTGLFGGSMTIEERSVMKFEPLAAELCAPGKHP